jgi:ribose transport system ATP-binding protein
MRRSDVPIMNGPPAGGAAAGIVDEHIDELEGSPGEALYLADVSKRFGATRALDRVSLQLKAGEVHGLVGSNGSGKSTLVKIVVGVHTPDSGYARLAGSRCDLPLSPAERRGIAVIHQDLGLVDGISALENLIVTTAFGAGPGRPIRWTRQAKSVRALLDRMELEIDLNAEVAALAPGQRTLLAVCRALLELQRARDTDGGDQGHVLILDEPTAALSDAESEAVWAVLRRISSAGGSALLITHHLHEVLEHCDRVTVLRDGRRVVTASCAGLDEGALVHSMLGVAAPSREQSRRPAAVSKRRRDVLAATDLRGHTLHGLSLGLGAGEIVGIVGLLGMGQDELPYMLAGSLRASGGAVTVDGRELPTGDPRAARKAGLVLIPQNRHRDGLWIEADGAENLGIVQQRRFMRAGIYRRRLELSSAEQWFNRLGVRPVAPALALSGFSGGNQQKVLLAKWLQTEPRVIVLHEPTQGVDVGAKLEIHNLLRRYASESGVAICLCSTDLEETEEMCDRVIVLRYGRAAGELTGTDIRSHAILGLANAG